VGIVVTKFNLSLLSNIRGKQMCFASVFFYIFCYRKAGNDDITGTFWRKQILFYWCWWTKFKKSSLLFWTAFI